jgi:outer membrane protein
MKTRLPEWISISVLTVAVIILFILNRNNEVKPNLNEKAMVQITDSSGNIIKSKIAYVNVDTLLAGYDYYDELKNKFDKQKGDMEGQFQSKLKAFETKRNTLIDKAQKGLMTRSEQQEAEMMLGEEQQNLMELRDDLTMKLAEEEQVIHKNLMNEIAEYLKVYNEENGYLVVLGGAFGSNVLYADPAIDITKDVILGINKRFKESKSKK